ncbi:MAG: hypothetical protein R2795_16105 [Saprospiraceae bacterium]
MTGTLFSWRICFNPVYQIDYEWTPATGLSCSDCPNPIASPDMTTTYVVTALDSYGCTLSDTITINVLPALDMSPLSCGITTTSSVQVTWDAVAGATGGYEVSVNGGPWMPPSEALAHTVTGLGLEETVTIEVRPLATCPGFQLALTVLR